MSVRGRASQQGLPRHLAWLLVPFALALLSPSVPHGDLLEMGPGASRSHAGPGDPVARVAAVLEEENPGLSTAEVLRISRAVVRQSVRYQLDPELVTAVLLVESGARPGARSPKGARGLMQVMPYMMRPMGLAGNLSTVESNIEAGCIILAGNIRRLGESDGISAYFWGSQIRDGAYLDRVRAARARVRSVSSAS